MKITKGDVLMFKAASESSEVDNFEKKLIEAGFKTVNVPVIEFEYVHLDDLKESLRKPSEFSGNVKMYDFIFDKYREFLSFLHNI